MTKKITTKLQRPAKFTLFVTSYFPLFVLIIGKQLSGNLAYLQFAGVSSKTLWVFFTKFGLSILLSILSIAGFLGVYWTFSNLKKESKNGIPATLTDVKNRNNESIGYIATYIIPFLFEDLNGPFEFFSIVFLLAVIYKIYVNSTMVIINPILSFWYSIYEINYKIGATSRNALVITRSSELLEGERVKLYQIGFKLYYASEFEESQEKNDV